MTLIPKHNTKNKIRKGLSITGQLLFLLGLITLAGANARSDLPLATKLIGNVLLAIFILLYSEIKLIFYKANRTLEELDKTVQEKSEDLQSIADSLDNIEEKTDELEDKADEIEELTNRNKSNDTQNND